MPKQAGGDIGENIKSGIASQRTTSLKLNGISGGITPLAIINGKTFAAGESGTIPFKPVPLAVKCLKIDTDTVTIAVDGEDAPRVLRLK